MPSVSGNGPKASEYQGVNSVDKEQELPKPVELVRYLNQVSEDEGYHSDPSVKTITDRKVEANPGGSRRRMLNDFKSVFGDVRMMLDTACTKQGVCMKRMPEWYYKVRYPVAFVRALQHLAPDEVDKLTADVKSNLAEVEAYLSLYMGFEKDSELSEIPLRDLVGLIQAGITYHVLLGNTEAAKQFGNVWQKYYSNKKTVVYDLQDATSDITRDLGLPF